MSTKLLSVVTDENDENANSIVTIALPIDQLRKVVWAVATINSEICGFHTDLIDVVKDVYGKRVEDHESLEDFLSELEELVYPGTKYERTPDLLKEREPNYTQDITGYE